VNLSRKNIRLEEWWLKPLRSEKNKQILSKRSQALLERSREQRQRNVPDANDLGLVDAESPTRGAKQKLETSMVMKERLGL